MKRLYAILFALLCGAAGLPQCGASELRALDVVGDVGRAHDPSMIRENTTYYVFTTGRASDGGQLGVRCSEDLIHWRFCGHVFAALPEWIRERSPDTRDLWAPDISFANGRYQLYYAYSLFGKNTSGIALATNKTLNPASPDYKWEDEGLVLESRATDDFNAIDPNYLQDRSGQAWLAFGSFWTGIKLRALDRSTGKLSSTDTTTYPLAERGQAAPENAALPSPIGNTHAIEAPFLVWHKGYYYLFVSFDMCCKGVKSTYRIMVGRSKAVTGPYLDRKGLAMREGGATEILAGNERWLGPGGQSVLQGAEGRDLLVFHAYDHTTGRPALQISPIAWKHGWPAAALSTR